MPTLTDHYREQLADHGYAADPAQKDAVQSLQAIQDKLTETGSSSFLQNLLGKKPALVKGLYLWGGVGRGKTWLMDLFFETLPMKNKGRWHFHRFMQQVHDELKTLKNKQDPLAIVAQRIANKHRVICFDEFFVSDIADAMILGTLFTYLFDAGITLIATSNIPPDNLYKDGLQRARFLPAIEKLKQHCNVMNVDNGIDYRLRTLEMAEIYHSPLDEASRKNMLDSFVKLTGGHEINEKTVTINNRKIPVERLGEDIIWFNFTALCDGPRSAADYIEIARCYHTVMLSKAPQLDITLENQARRFISLVDEFYDHNVKLILSAAVTLDNLYTGKRLQFEFRRTNSRLTEMQSRDYLSREHLA